MQEDAQRYTLALQPFGNLQQEPVGLGDDYRVALANIFQRSVKPGRLVAADDKFRRLDVAKLGLKPRLLVRGGSLA